jgi:hypothetical protein
VFKEITGVALNDSLVELEFHGHYRQYRWEILNSPRTVCLLTLTRGPVSLATTVSEPASSLLAVGSGGRATFIFTFWLLTLTRGPATIFFQMKRAPLRY